jgi:hypothetical protein
MCPGTTISPGERFLSASLKKNLIYSLKKTATAKILDRIISQDN